MRQGVANKMLGLLADLKEETHAARWGLLRGYSGKATKWVDFVMTDSTRRESSHLLNIEGILTGVKRIVGPKQVSSRG